MVLNIIVDGLMLGALFAVASIGLSMFYSSTGIFNLAHGALLILGGYLVYTGLATLSLPLPLAVVFSVLTLSIFSMLFYRYFLHPIRHHHLTSVLITLALLLVLERLTIVLYGPWGLPFPTVFPGVAELAGVEVSMQKIAVTILSLAFIAFLWFVMNKTWVGLAIRATIDNIEASAASGINSDRIILFSVFLASAVTAVGGVSIASTLFLSPILMSQMNMVAIAVAILAGLGSLWGVIPAAFILGFSDVIGALYFGGWYRFVNLALVIIIVLLVRPEGIFGERERIA
ncbi:MAG TPA: branched-chain amino acid ABC transporter permease [Aigarchaeota archaeon]|nr:branched-chain amino acid ABC transporter permease [Aigarchaeota archaeon]